MTEFKPDRQTPPSAAAHHLPPQAGSAELDAIFAVARTLTLPAQQPVFHSGSPCRQYLLVTAGRVCVYLSAENGREVTLYHVEPGHSCVLTTSCLLGGELYPAAAVTETEVTALAIDAQTVAHSLENSA
jgi:CRP/FNR family transcriptional regulator